MPYIPGLGDPRGNTPEGELSTEQPIESTTNNPWIDLLRQEFKAPFLGLLKHYLNTTNSKNKKTLESCLGDFRAKYPKRFKLMFHADALVHSVFLLFVFLFVIRGLGMEREIRSIFDYILLQIRT